MSMERVPHVGFRGEFAFDAEFEHPCPPRMEAKLGIQK
jgi:hypothetical protein